MFLATDTAWAPLVRRAVRRQKESSFEHNRTFLSRIPYAEIKRDKVKLPKRHVSDLKGRVEYPFKLIP